MSVFSCLRKQGINLIRWIEEHLGRWILKLLINRKLYITYLKGIPSMDPAYKKEVRAYWKPFTTRFTINWHRFYADRTGVKDARIIPNDIYFAVVLPYMNRMKLSHGLRDKNYMSLLFPEIAQPKTIVRRLNGEWLDTDYHFLGRDTAIKQIIALQEVIIKPTLATGGGEGIQFWHANDSSPILVEPNYWRGSIDLHQFSNGPLFGELTEEVLEAVFDK